MAVDYRKMVPTPVPTPTVRPTQTSSSTPKTNVIPASGMTSQYAINPSNYQQYQSKPDVLGTTTITTPSGGGGGGGGGATWWDDSKNMGQLNGQTIYDKNQWLQQGGQQQPNYDQMIEDLYNQGMGVLNDQEAQVRAGNEADIQSTNNRYNEQMQGITNEQNQYNQDYDTQEKKYNDTIKTALNQAITAYNALQQQQRARFGLGSSAGAAVGELAQQEFLRQQGNIQNKQAEGSLQFQQERDKIKQYISDKTTKLDNWKNEALSQLRVELGNKLNEIAGRKYDLAQNKTRDKMSILESIRQQALQIAEADKQFRRDLGLAAVSKMQELAGRAFTPKEISTVLSDFGISMPNIGSSSSNVTNALPAYGYRMSGKQNDEFATLNPVATQGSENV